MSGPHSSDRSVPDRRLGDAYATPPWAVVELMGIHLQQDLAAASLQ
jgi:hypothetical protein